MTAPNRRSSTESVLGDLASRVAKLEANRSSALPIAFVNSSQLGTITTDTLLEWSSLANSDFGTTDPSIFEMNPDNTGILIKQPGYYFGQVSLWNQGGGNTGDTAYLTLWTNSFTFGNGWGETGAGSPLELAQIPSDPLVAWSTARVFSAAGYGGTTHPSLGVVMTHSGSNINLSNLASGLMIWRVGNMFNTVSI